MIKRIKNSYVAKNYRNIYSYIKPYWFRALLAIFVTIPVGMIDTAIPWALKNYMDSIASGKSSIVSAFMPLLIFGFTIIQSIFTYTSIYLNSWVGAKISNGLKYDLFKNLIRNDASFFDKNTSGTIQTRFNNDVDTACTGLLNHLKMFLTRIFSSISLIVALFVISWRLAIIAILTLVLAFYPLTTIRKRIDGIVKETVSSGSAISTRYIEAFSGNRVITSYGLFESEEQKIDNSLNLSFKLSMKMVQRTGILSPIMHFVIGGGIALIIWCGSYLIDNGLLTAGEFVAFVTSIIMLYQPIKSMSNDFNAVNLSIMAIERVFSLLKIKPALATRPNAIILPSVRNKIEYRDVSFEYEKGVTVLNRINVNIKVGQTIALVGNSGGGKTTFVNLLPRFYDVSSGAVLIDGIDIRDIDLGSLRKKISVVFQDNFLFTGSILENILLGKKDATSKEINQAVKSACLEEFISKLSSGLYTEIGERGALLSGGQKQRIAIARAFIKDAPIVILDEATSALDNKSESVVQKAIDNLMKDRTVFIVAHRLSTVKNADKVIVLNQGEIVEIGTHNELIMKGNAYASLYGAIKT